MKGKLLSVRTCRNNNIIENDKSEENRSRSNSKKKNEEGEKLEEVPMSPTSESLLYTPIRNVVLLESDERADTAVLRAFALAAHNQSPRMSCIAKEDRQGNIKLYKTQVDMDRHLVFTELPEEEQEQERAVEEYIKKLETTELDPSKPQWEFHMLRGEARTVTVFKIHHALADGVSMLASMLVMARCADDPSRKPRLPFIKAPTVPQQSLCEMLLLTPMKAVADVVDTGLRMLGLRCDTVFPIAQVTVVTETQAGDHRAVCLSLKLIKSIKTMMAATVNDVICGIIFDAFKRYLAIRDAAAEAKISIDLAYEGRSELLTSSAIIRNRKPTKFTAVIPLNTRAITALMKMQGTVTEKSKISWGNHFVIIFLDICLEAGDTVWDAIRTVKRIADSKKKSGYLQQFMMDRLTKCLNPKTVNSYFETAFRSASIGITNVPAPAEKICINSYRVTKVRFSSAPSPHALDIYVTSYVDDMILNVVAFKPFVDINIFCECLHQSVAEAASAVKTTDCGYQN